MRTSRTILRTDDGVDLAVRVWEPQGQARGTVVIAHGMVEHSGRYRRLACALVGAGYAVLAPDHRGHGHTAGDVDRVGHLADEDGWALAVDDLGLVVAHARAQRPLAPVVLLGHSMGSLMARTYVLDRGHAVDGLVLSGTAGDPGALGRVGAAAALTERRLRGPRHRSSALDRMVFGGYNADFEPARTPFDWLSRDEDEVDAYVADPRCGAVATSAFYADLLGAMGPINDPARIAGMPSDLPVLLLAGDADPVGARGAGPLAVARLLREAGLRDVSVRLYPGARHEIFNETNKEEVTDDLLDWLDARVPPVIG